MSTVDEIEAAIDKLAPTDFARLRDWLLERDQEIWDKQIIDDSASGKLSHLVQEIEADIASGKTKPLSEISNG